MKKIIYSQLSFFLLLVLVEVAVEGKSRKQRRLDRDFEFADENEGGGNGVRTLGKDGKKTWILDPGSDLCQALTCKKEELCLLEDEFTSVCVSKRDLHKHGDVIVPKSKLMYSKKNRNSQSSSTSMFQNDQGVKKDETNQQQLEEEDEDSSDYYDDEDDDDDEDDNSSESSPFSSKSTSAVNNKPSSSNANAKTIDQDSRGKACNPCPVVKPTFICGSDNRTYSSLCRLDYHNCMQSTGRVGVACKGFCPCKEITTSFPHTFNKKKSSVVDKLSYKNNYFPSSKLSSKATSTFEFPTIEEGKVGGESNNKRPGPPPQLPDKSTTSSGKKRKTSSSSNNNSNGVSLNEGGNSNPQQQSSFLGEKDRYAKYKDYYGYKSPGNKHSMDKLRSHNDVLHAKQSSSYPNRDCSEEALQSMGTRLLEWFSVVRSDTQKRKLGRNNRRPTLGHPFTPDCKKEVAWMFSHLNTEDDNDGLLSLHELYDLEHDRNERCIKPFLDKCDGDKDIFISPKEWCNCFNFNTNKLCAVGLSGVSNCGSPDKSNSIPPSSNTNNNLNDDEDGDSSNGNGDDDDEDDDVDSSGDGVDGDLEI